MSTNNYLENGNQFLPFANNAYSDSIIPPTYKDSKDGKIKHAKVLTRMNKSLSDTQAAIYELQNGDLVISFRGTELGVEGIKDLFNPNKINKGYQDVVKADGSIAKHNLPIPQLADVYKFIEKNRKVIEKALKAGKDVNICGHSLGGYLSQAAILMFPDLLNTPKVKLYTYNAPSAYYTANYSIDYRNFEDEIKRFLTQPNISGKVINEIPFGKKDGTDFINRIERYQDFVRRNQELRNEYYDIQAFSPRKDDNMSAVIRAGGKIRYNVNAKNYKKIEVPTNSHTLNDIENAYKLRLICEYAGISNNRFNNIIQYLYNNKAPLEENEEKISDSSLYKKSFKSW